MKHIDAAVLDGLIGAAPNIRDLHLIGGSNPQPLAEQWQAFAIAIKQAIELLPSPHGRDYVDPATYTRAETAGSNIYQLLRAIGMVATDNAIVWADLADK